MRSPSPNERGQIVEWVGSHTDITEQRDAQQRVRDSLQRLELALDAASVGMWDWDLDTGRMTWTHQTHLITGIVTAEVHRAGPPVLRVAAAGRASITRPRFRARCAARPGEVKELEFQFRRADGSAGWAQNRATGITDSTDARAASSARCATSRAARSSKRSAKAAHRRARRARRARAVGAGEG